MPKATPKPLSPLTVAIARGSANWLEVEAPEIHAALLEEIQEGKTLPEIEGILRMNFGEDVRKPFVRRVLQAAQHHGAKA